LVKVVKFKDVEGDKILAAIAKEEAKSAKKSAKEAAAIEAAEAKAKAKEEKAEAAAAAAKAKAEAAQAAADARAAAKSEAAASRAKEKAQKAVQDFEHKLNALVLAAPVSQASRQPSTALDAEADHVVPLLTELAAPSGGPEGARPAGASGQAPGGTDRCLGTGRGGKLPSLS